LDLARHRKVAGFFVLRILFPSCSPTLPTDAALAWEFPEEKCCGPTNSTSALILINENFSLKISDVKASNASYPPD